MTENNKILQSNYPSIKKIHLKSELLYCSHGCIEKRVKALESLANKLANKVVKTGRNTSLEPMNAYERRIIHATLQNHEQVTTYSVGQGMRRKVVIALKKD